MKKLLIGGLITLLAGLMVSAAGCGPGVSSTTATSPPSGPAVKLVFITQPAGATAGSPLETQPVVAIEDTAGNITTAGPAPVELTLTSSNSPGEARIFGVTKMPPVNGVTAFKSLSINKAGTYRLTATSGSLTPATSAPFSIVPGPPQQLTFTTQPSGGPAGSPLPAQPVVAVLDSYRNEVTDYEGSVTLWATITLPTDNPNAAYGDTTPVMQTTGATIYGTLTAPIVDGAARFTDVSAHLAIPGYRLTATCGSLASATSGFFTISPGAPAELEFTVQPGGATAGTPFATQPKVAIEDTYGNVVTSSRASISLSITPASGAAGAALSGTTALVAEDAMGGLAEFTDLSIDLAGPAYTLTASSGGLPPAVSQPFDVSSP